MRRRVDPKRVAIVGAGVSGLVAASELHRAGHDIHLFEAAGYPGGHTNTIDVETPLGTWPVERASSSSTNSTIRTSIACWASWESPHSRPI